MQIRVALHVDISVLVLRVVARGSLLWRRRLAFGSVNGSGRLLSFNSPRLSRLHTNTEDVKSDQSETLYTASSVHVMMYADNKNWDNNEGDKHWRFLVHMNVLVTCCVSHSTENTHFDYNLVNTWQAPCSNKWARTISTAPAASRDASWVCRCWCRSPPTPRTPDTHASATDHYRNTHASWDLRNSSLHTPVYANESIEFSTFAWRNIREETSVPEAGVKVTYEQVKHNKHVVSSKKTASSKKRPLNTSDVHKFTDNWVCVKCWMFNQRSEISRSVLGRILLQAKQLLDQQKSPPFRTHAKHRQHTLNDVLWQQHPQVTPLRSLFSNRQAEILTHFRPLIACVQRSIFNKELVDDFRMQQKF